MKYVNGKSVFLSDSDADLLYSVFCIAELECACLLPEDKFLRFQRLKQLLFDYLSGDYII